MTDHFRYLGVGKVEVALLWLLSVACFTVWKRACVHKLTYTSIRAFRILRRLRQVPHALQGPGLRVALLRQRCWPRRRVASRTAPSEARSVSRGSAREPSKGQRQRPKPTLGGRPIQEPIQSHSQVSQARSTLRGTATSAACPSVKSLSNVRPSSPSLIHRSHDP